MISQDKKKEPEKKNEPEVVQAEAQEGSKVDDDLDFKSMGDDSEKDNQDKNKEA